MITEMHLLDKCLLFAAQEARVFTCRRREYTAHISSQIAYHASSARPKRVPALAMIEQAKCADELVCLTKAGSNNKCGVDARANTVQVRHLRICTASHISHRAREDKHLLRDCCITIS
jgi:hypothetical protein